MAVADQKSVQLTLTDAGAKVASPTWQSRFERRYFNIATVVGDAGSTIRFVPIYKNERLVGGHIAAVIAGAAGATLSLGITGSVAKFMAATLIDAALDSDFANTPALGLGELQTADGEIIGTTAVGALLDAKAIGGYVDVLKV